MEQSSESGEVEDIFRKSRKTVRSSGKKREGEGEIGDGAREDDRKGEKADSVLEVVKNEIREGLRGIREEMKEMIKTVDGMLTGGLDEMRREIEEIKKGLKLKEEEWGKERKLMMERIEKLEKDLEEGCGMTGKIEKRMEIVERKEGIAANPEKVGIWERMERTERIMKRERRKKNLVFKGVRKVEEDSKEEIKNICRKIEVDIEIEEIRKIKTEREEKGDMLIVKVRSEENKRKILENKRKLKGGSIWIEEDLSFKERKMKWNLRRVAEEERRRGGQ